MRILIIEDELTAAKRLINLVKAYDPKIDIMEVIDNVADAVQFLSKEIPDLIMMDVQLADGICFEIFEEVEVNSPVIFVTAYDKYSLQAFKVNSVDYLLKPINQQDLEASFEKFKKYNYQAPIQSAYHNLVKSFSAGFKKRFLVRSGNNLVSIETRKIAYFISDEKLNYLVSNNSRRYVIDYSLEDLINKLDPGKFFKISRKFIVSSKCVKQIQPYFSNRLVLKIQPNPEKEVYVSRNYVKDFKRWLDL